MSDASLAQPMRFTARGALGFGWAVFRARPISFLRLSALQVVLFALLGLLQLWLLGYFGQGIVDAGTDMAAVMRASSLVSLSSLTGSLVMMAASIWIELLWLRVFLGDRANARPAFWRLLAAFVILYGLMMVALLVITILGVFAATGVLIAYETGGTQALLGAGAIVGALVFTAVLAALWLLSRFSALPPLVLLRPGLPLGEAWRISGRVQGRLFLAWLGVALVYLLAASVTGALLVLGPGPYAEAMTMAFTRLDDPWAQYAVYAAFARSPGEMLAFGGALMIGNGLFVGVMALARGVGVQLALSAGPDRGRTGAGGAA